MSNAADSGPAVGRGGDRREKVEHAMTSRIRSAVVRTRTAALGLGLAFGLSACAEDKPLNTFEPRGPKAEDIDNLMSPIWIIMGIVFVLVIGGAIWISIANRVKADEYDPEDLPAQTHGNTPLELTWTIVPGLLLAVISVFMVGEIWSLEERNEPDELDVMVIGQQWWWEYRYDVDGDGFFVDANGDGVANQDPGGDDAEFPLHLALDPDDVVTANELVIPAGQQVDLLLTSRDVIHSYWIPRLNGKRDTVPGRWHTWSIEASEPGKYTGWCTEFCGLSHARMRMSAIALPEAEFADWLENQALPAEVPEEGTEAWEGRAIFEAQCMSCHVIDDDVLEYGENFQAALTAGAAPNLTHFATRSVFAGAIYNSYAGPGTDANDDALPWEDYLALPELAANPTSPDDYRWNAAELKRWIGNAPSRKDMDPDDLRGMPAFPQLTDEQLDQLVAYLATLD